MSIRFLWHLSSVYAKIKGSLGDNKDVFLIGIFIQNVNRAVSGLRASVVFYFNGLKKVIYKPSSVPTNIIFQSFCTETSIARYVRINI